VPTHDLILPAPWDEVVNRPQVNQSTLRPGYCRHGRTRSRTSSAESVRPPAMSISAAASFLRSTSDKSAPRRQLRPVTGALGCVCKLGCPRSHIDCYEPTRLAPCPMGAAPPVAPPPPTANRASRPRPSAHRQWHPGDSAPRDGLARFPRAPWPPAARRQPPLPVAEGGHLAASPRRHPTAS
jgi:hypothetical protein